MRRRLSKQKFLCFYSLLVNYENQEAILFMEDPVQKLGKPTSTKLQVIKFLSFSLFSHFPTTTYKTLVRKLFVTFLT